MLNADFNRIGIAHVMLGGVHYWVQEFAVSNSSITTTAANDSSTSVEVQIDESKITSSTIQTSVSSIKLAEKESCALPTASISLSVSGHWGSALEADANCRWSVSNTSIAKISGSSLVGVSQGSTSLKATVNGQTVTIPVTVNHVPVTDPAVPATCTKTGLTAGSHCSVCGKIIKAQKTVPMIAHTPVTDPAVPATCSKTGLTEGSHCSVCDTVITAQETVPKIAHKSVTDPAVKPTCTSSGLTEGSHCSVCGTVITAQKTVPKIAHAPETDPAVKPTCTSSGLTEGSHCSVCGTIITAQKKVNALGHEWGEWTVTKEATYDRAGEKQRVCSRDSSHIETDEIPKLVKSGFSDVQDQKHPYYKAIYWAAGAEITKGYPDGTFGINKSCTRGEMIMFLWRYVGKPAPKAASKSPFKDVPTNHTFYKAILWGSQKGITKGYSDGSFGINRNVTRGEAMMFLWRLKGKPAPKAAATSPFKDVPKTHVFYKAILWGAQKKVTTGYTSGAKKGTFGIDENCTRGQIVTFLYRAK
jgi:predicted nucleic acid-binding Zn ribbon protein